MSRYAALEIEIDKLKKENQRLSFALHDTNAPERTLAGVINKLESYIEDNEWRIVRCRATIKTYQAAIAKMRADLKLKRQKQARR